MKRLWVKLFVVFIFSCDKSFLTKAELINNYSDFKVLEYKFFNSKEKAQNYLIL
jgi:hypothetical protein